MCRHGDENFVPFGADEFLRVLKPGGYVLKVEPAHDHLLEMKQVLYDQVYENREAPQAYAGLTLRSEQVIRDRIIVQGQQMIHALFQMTPYFYRSPKAGAKRSCAPGRAGYAHQSSACAVSKTIAG